MKRFSTYLASLRRILPMAAAVATAWCGATPASAEPASPSAEQEKIVVRVFGMPTPGSSNPNDIANLKVIEEFGRRFPHIQLESVSGLKVEGLGAEIGPLMMIAGGISPDIIYVNFRKIDSYVRSGILYPLNEYIDAEESKSPGWTSDRILSNINDVVQRTGVDGQKAYYAMPTQYYIMGLYYNRLLFRQAGLPQRAPRDWNEMLAFSRRIKEFDAKSKPVLLSAGQQASWNLMNFLWSTGADAVQEMAPDDWRAVYNTDEAVEAFRFYYQLVEKERVAFRESNISQLISSAEGRRVGMTFGYIGNSSGFDPNVWSYGAVPVGPTGLRGSEVNAAMMGIFAGVKDKKVRDAAWEYINFYGSVEAQKLRADTLVSIGAGNQVSPTDLRRFGYESLLALQHPGLEEEFKTALANGKPEPYGKNCDLVYIEITYPLDQMLLSPRVRDSWAKDDQNAVFAEIKTILNNAVSATNERMLGIVPEEKMATRRYVAWAVVIVILASFFFVGRTILRAFSAVGAARTRVRGKQVYMAWGLLGIPLLLAFMWSYLPLVRGAWMSLLDYQIMLKSTFVGIDNFANILFDTRFWTSMAATFHFAFWMLTVGFVIPILLAYLLHLVPRQKMLFRTIYYLPALLTGTAVFVLWKEFFGVHGMVNSIFQMIGFDISRAWPEDPTFAMLACVIPGVWAGAGPGCLIYLAALKTIPEEQFEASEIDGAGFFKKTIHIVIPALMPLIIINFIGAVMASFQASQNILIMTGGGPNGLTEVAALRIFYQAFMFLQFGPATAMAWILGSMLVGFALIQLKRLSQMEFKSGG